MIKKNSILRLIALVILIIAFSLLLIPAKAGISISIKESFFQETYVNQPVTITATPLSGEPPYTYQWYTQLWSSGSGGKPLGPITPFPDATNSTFRFIEEVPGTYDISLKINGEYDSFPPMGCWVVVKPLPSVTPSPIQTSITTQTVSPTPSLTPSVPEFSWLTILPILLTTTIALIFTKKRLSV